MRLIKIGELIAEIPDETEDVFDVDFGGHYLLQITKYDGCRYEVTNGVDGYGNNCCAEFKHAAVQIFKEQD